MTTQTWTVADPVDPVTRGNISVAAGSKVQAKINTLGVTDPNSMAKILKGVYAGIVREDAIDYIKTTYASTIPAGAALDFIFDMDDDYMFHPDFKWQVTATVKSKREAALMLLNGWNRP